MRWLVGRQHVGTGSLHFAKCSPCDIAELVVVGRLAPALKGDLPSERAQPRGHARGQVGNAAALKRVDHRCGEAESLERFAFPQFRVSGDHCLPPSAEPGDTVLVGGAAGGVGVFAVQLAKLAGATVIGTASESTFEFPRQLGAEPVAYGPGLADRVRTLAPEGVTAATDLFGTETAETALAMGVPPERISTIAARQNPPAGVRATGGIEASPDAMEQITDAILAGGITVPIAATFPIEQIRDAVTLQAGRHVHGKVVITL